MAVLAVFAASNTMFLANERRGCLGVASIPMEANLPPCMLTPPLQTKKSGMIVHEFLDCKGQPLECDGYLG